MPNQEILPGFEVLDQTEGFDTPAMQPPDRGHEEAVQNTPAEQDRGGSFASDGPPAKSTNEPYALDFTAPRVRTGHVHIPTEEEVARARRHAAAIREQLAKHRDSSSL